MGGDRNTRQNRTTNHGSTKSNTRSKRGAKKTNSPQSQTASLSEREPTVNNIVTYIINMDRTDKIILLIIAVYLAMRQWPYGDPPQTATDVMFGITATLLITKNVWLKRRG